VKKTKITISDGDELNSGYVIEQKQSWYGKKGKATDMKHLKFKRFCNTWMFCTYIGKKLENHSNTIIINAGAQRQGHTQHLNCWWWMDRFVHYWWVRFLFSVWVISSIYSSYLVAVTKMWPFNTERLLNFDNYQIREAQLSFKLPVCQFSKCTTQD
jgi:hypothetical protein